MMVSLCLKLMSILDKSNLLSSCFPQHSDRINSPSLLEEQTVGSTTTVLRIARWTVPDPMAEKYYGVNAYGYCHNNPIFFIDNDGRDPIYSKRRGKVELIGDDGKNGTVSYLVRGPVARQVRRATEAGESFSGDLSENKYIMRIPTGEKLMGVIQSYEDTKVSQKENGGHSYIGDTEVTRWDEGVAATSYSDENGNLITRASLQMFVINGQNTMPASTSDVELWWHTHPNITINGVSLGSSTPSSADFKGQNKMVARGYKGNTFVIGVRSNTVTFFNGNRVLITVDWPDFIKMGRQE